MLGIGRQRRLQEAGLFASWISAFFFLIGLLMPAELNAQTVPDIPPADFSALEETSDTTNGLEPLFLEVLINEQATNLIASFYKNGNGKIGAAASELREIGIKTPDEAGPDDIIYLADIPSVQYEYNEATQLLKINIVDAQRLAKEYDLGAKPNEYEISKPGIGAVVNYSLFATSSAPEGRAMEINNISANLDGWVYGPLGKIYGSGIVSTDNFNAYDFLRLDTTWSYSDVKTLRVYNVGDAISGGLAWTRPVRFGGFQMQKNFGLRPDLIATPLLQASGSAAVPSTVDIYVNNFKAHTQKVDAGPFTINQVPSVSGAGNARIVIKDATGREEETIKPFYISTNLLRKGLFDYSVEAGFSRLNYGTLSNNYSRDFMASGTFRYGVTDKFTLEGHAEGGNDLLNGGIGASFTVADRALFTLAGSASSSDEGTGYQLYGSIDSQLWGMNLHASSRRSFGNYQDLASISASEIVDTGTTLGALSGTGIAKAFDQVSLGIPLPKVKGGLNLSFTHLENVINETTNVASISYSQKVFGKATLSVSGYTSIDNTSDAGVYIGLSFPLGEKIYASTSVESIGGDLSYRASASKSTDSKPGSWGWQISDTEGASVQRRAGVTYRGNNTFSQLNVHQNEIGFLADAYVSGAVVVADAGVFLAPRIDDAFAVVDAGVPDVPVYLANHYKGKTNKFGKLLVPGLLSYEENRLRIETENLPINASVETTSKDVVPGGGAGVNVRFGIITQAKNAVVVFVDKNGENLEVGTEGKLVGSDNEFIVGYDGRTYIEGLSANNSVTIITESGECAASFEFTSAEDQQVEIGPVVCQ